MNRKTIFRFSTALMFILLSSLPLAAQSERFHELHLAATAAPPARKITSDRIASITPTGTNTTQQRGDYVQGYGFVGPGLIAEEDPILQVGGGVELVDKNGWGVGAELAYLHLFDNAGRVGFGTVYLNAGYHFRRATASGKLVPFVSGGYAAMFRNGVGHGFNYGGGINYWFADRAALRVEARGQLIGNTDLAQGGTIRVGLTFR